MAPPPSDDTASPLTKAEQETLLTLARGTLARYFATGTLPLPRPAGILRAPRGAFVTLKKAGALRGCVGHMRADLPLCQMVGRMALEAALRDRRFPPVTAGELASLEIEVSALTPFERIDTPEAIRVGRDGVLLRKQGRSAVFLPQVAPEQGWERDEMLAHLCRKAGLPPDAWRSGAALFTFQAEVFGESTVR
jgi:AmmeMemoRadiSam system protein A